MIASDTLIKLFFTTIFLLTVIILIDFFFLKFYRLIKKTNYFFRNNVSIKNILFESHPYLPFVLKKKIIHNKTSAEYPLNNVRSPFLISNQYGFFNGKNGNRNVVSPKPKKLIRINCIGGSTTGNYIEDNNKVYSYPLELEKFLMKKYPKKKIEVNNFGMGGYNSADILVSSILSQIDTKPDYIIIYHAYNDIRSYLTENFKSDYSHSRQNFSKNYYKLVIHSLLPNLPINFYNFLKNYFFIGSDLRFSLHHMISKGKFNINNKYDEGLKTFKRNMFNIINVYKSIGSKIIICKYCFYLHKKIKNDRLHKVYKKIVKKENLINENLAKKFGVKFINTDQLLKNANKNFLDSVHFSSEGMQNLAKLIGKQIRI